jgi:hypothetical protein
MHGYKTHLVEQHKVTERVAMLLNKTEATRLHEHKHDTGEYQDEHPDPRDQ